MHTTPEVTHPLGLGLYILWRRSHSLAMDLRASAYTLSGLGVLGAAAFLRVAFLGAAVFLGAAGLGDSVSEETSGMTSAMTSGTGAVTAANDKVVCRVCRFAVGAAFVEGLALDSSNALLATLLVAWLVICGVGGDVKKRGVGT